MKYKEMLEHAKAKGLASEKTMWDSIDDIEDMLCYMKREHPDKYWRFMQNQHAIMWNNHYSEDFAEYDIEHIKYKDKEGKEHEGGHWTKDQVLSATSGKTYPPGTTDCDKWVAYNVMYADLNKVLDDARILDVAYAFFFADDDFDYTKGGKVWKYMSALAV